MHRFLALGIAAAPALLAAQVPVGSLTVHTNRPLHPMAKGFYGLMTEEINHSYDGGIYGELVQNRALKDAPDRAVRWSDLNGGEATLDPEGVPGTELMKSLRIEGPGGVANEGFWGFPVRANTPYRASLYVKGEGQVTVAIESADGSKTWAKAETRATGGWRKVELRLRTGEAPTSANNRLVVRHRGGGTLRVAGVSLFGPTVKGRPNGNRPDLMDLLAGMRPTFLRLPGGNYLEGDTVADRFDWKRTLGPVESRPGHMAPWGYRSSDGLGLLEYLEWCEDLRMKPLLAVFAGYALRGERVEPGPALAPFVQDALDEIEYVTGDASTKWGAARAKGGHPKPFALEYVEIGNEDNFDRSGSYDGRFAQFYDAIKANYPRLQIIATTGVKSRTPDVMDDHYYRTPAEMARDSGHYDRTDRKGPKIFVGEWASLQGEPTPDFQAALGDAAWLTGLERDSDIVAMEAYAPLFTNVNRGAAQWNTNLIGYDALRSFGSPSYWVQSMFAQNGGDTVLPVDVDARKPSEAFPFRGGVGLAGAGVEYSSPQVEGHALPGIANWSAVGVSGMITEAHHPDGSATVTLEGRNPVLLAGDPSWTDQTFTVLTRKPVGDHWASLRFHALDSHNFWQWNVGGTRNEIRHQEIFANRVVKSGEPMVIKEQGGYTTLRLEVKGGHVRGYVDGKLAIEADEAAPAIPTVYATASQRGGETILKVVNLSATDAPLTIDLAGAAGKGLSYKGSVLSGPLFATNSLDSPLNVAPRPVEATTLRAGEPYRFLAHSVTVLRLRMR